MLRLAFLLLLAASPAWSLTPAAKEFLEISKQLEPVQCEKRQLRRAMAMAQVENRGPELKKLQEKFSALDRTPQTAKLERRLAQLEPRITASTDTGGPERDQPAAARGFLPL